MAMCGCALFRMNECFLEYLQKQPAGLTAKYKNQWTQALPQLIGSLFGAAAGVGIGGFCYTKFVEPFDRLSMGILAVMVVCFFCAAVAMFNAGRTLGKTNVSVKTACAEYRQQRKAKLLALCCNKDKVKVC